MSYALKLIARVKPAERVAWAQRNGGKVRPMPHSIDLWCKFADETVANVTSGCPTVAFAFDSTYPIADGCLPVVKPLAGQLRPVIGVAHWDNGTLQAGQEGWVRVWGPHPYCQYNAAALLNEALQNHNTSTGQLAPMTTSGALVIGVALETMGAAGVGEVLLLDPCRLCAGLL